MLYDMGFSIISSTADMIDMQGDLVDISLVHLNDIKQFKIRTCIQLLTFKWKINYENTNIYLHNI